MHYYRSFQAWLVLRSHDRILCTTFYKPSYPVTSLVSVPHDHINQYDFPLYLTLDIWSGLGIKSPREKRPFSKTIGSYAEEFMPE